MPTASIQYVEDKNGDVFFPVAHVNGIVNNDGDTLNTILGRYPQYVLCASEAAYNAITTKDSGTLYLIPEE